MIAELIQQSGMPYDLTMSKAIKLGINTNGFISHQNRQSLSSIFIIEKKDSFLLVPSKMNFDNEPIFY